MGLVALCHVRSFGIKNWTHLFCTGRQTLNYWATREAFPHGFFQRLRGFISGFLSFRTIGVTFLSFHLLLWVEKESNEMKTLLGNEHIKITQVAAVHEGPGWSYALNSNTVSGWSFNRIQHPSRDVREEGGQGAVWERTPRPSERGLWSHTLYQLWSTYTCSCPATQDCFFIFPVNCICTAFLFGQNWEIVWWLMMLGG